MRIIIEGPDNGGKTTLANTLLAEQAGLIYHHPGGRPADAAAEAKCLHEQMTMVMRHDKLLMDRCTAISQQVYSPHAVRDPERKAHLKNLIDEGVLFVYCRPGTDWLMSFEHFTWREGETEEFKQEIIAKQHVFIERYDELMRTVPHIHFDYRGDEASAIIKHIVLAISGNQTSINLLNAMKVFEVPKCK